MQKILILKTKSLCSCSLLSGLHSSHLLTTGNSIIMLENQCASLLHTSYKYSFSVKNMVTDWQLGIIKATASGDWSSITHPSCNNLLTDWGLMALSE